VSFFIQEFYNIDQFIQALNTTFLFGCARSTLRKGSAQNQLVGYVPVNNRQPQVAEQLANILPIEIPASEKEKVELFHTIRHTFPSSFCIT
jgi:hypothetical protein